jgi:hypothetical protein
MTARIAGAALLLSEIWYGRNLNWGTPTRFVGIHDYGIARILKCAERNRTMANSTCLDDLNMRNTQ